MEGPAILVEALRDATIKDKYGNRWQYHSRSDRHSKVACWGIGLDLLTKSALLRRHVADGKVILGVNHTMRDFGTGRKKDLDLVLARPDGEPDRRVTFGQLAERYTIPLTSAQRAMLDALPELPVAPVGAVLVALEAKATMTAHIRALPRLYDELNSSHLCVHGASRQALAIGFAIINASSRFASSDMNKFDLTSANRVFTEEPQPRSLVRTLEKLVEMPRRSNTRETGFDGVGVVVIDGANGGSPFKLVTAPPAPQPGEPFHYDGMITRMANEYDTSFSSI
ncbi:hypothetical protein [Dermatobacter hominis]|uniref:hypothetical protein n=1 Tax=Dermatobacter hominis TaxID=2884263 RepID=UPI001D0F64F0|nr:hypothetical protein [Dermatobacter hominis]UDY34530.1 hypothetical protein LH044_14445 [Dermatobacter hominis]